VEVTNLSDKTLQISSITSAQNFITVNLAKSDLPILLKPQEKMSFQVNLDAALMKEKTWGQIIINTDNQHTPKITLYVTGRVQSQNQTKKPSPTTGKTPLPPLTFSEQAKKLFPRYNFVFNNVTKNLAECDFGRCLPMKAYIQLLIDQKIPEEKITKAIQYIYGPKAITSLEKKSKKSPINTTTLKESIQKALKDNSKAKLELFVMSYCPFALRAEKAMEKIIAEFNSKIELQLYFIASPKTENSDKTTDLFTSLHGPLEVEEDFRQVLIQKYFPEKLFPYLQHRNKNIKTADWKKCLNKAGIDQKKIEKLMNDEQSRQLFSDNIAKAKKIKIHASPTLLINGIKYKGGFK